MLLFYNFSLLCLQKSENSYDFHTHFMKIYTKTGDRGETSLLGGKRVKKSCLEIEAIGEVDELNAYLGVLIAQMPDGETSAKERLTLAQHRLFVAGSNLADVQMQLGSVPRLTPNYVTQLEQWIDAMENKLSPLTQFILPAGTPAAAHAFFARALCRRAERRVVAVRESYPALDPLVQQYLNRLSDALFVLGRWLNHKHGVAETLWQK